MDVFLAAQPIFDSKRNVMAYELLYRSGSKKNTADFSFSGDQATKLVIMDTIMAFGLQKITQGKKAFINFTKNLIMEDYPYLFKPSEIVVEVLEDVIFDEELIEKCKELKEDGYVIALDDMIMDNYPPEVMDFISIIKVDFLDTNIEMQRELANKYKGKGKKLLAEKVETNEEFYSAEEMGYDLYQGFFFEKPTISVAKNNNSFSPNYVELMNELYNETPDFRRIKAIIEVDVKIVYKIVKLVNSAAFMVRREINSVDQAISMLGVSGLKKFVTLMLVRNVSDTGVDEIAKLSFARGKFCEKIANEIELGQRSNEAFMGGMFSLIDVMLEKPMEEAIEELPITEDVKKALLGEKNVFFDLILLYENYESAEWAKVIKMGMKYGVHYEKISEYYIESLVESNEIWDNY